MLGLPGEELARELGYTLHSYSGDRSAAFYNNDEGVFLEVFNDGEAQLTAVYKMVQLKVGPFSFPNKNFSIFERQIRWVKQQADQW